MEVKKYRYFVSFSCDGNPGLSLGNAEISLDRPISNHRDIKEVARILMADGDVTKVTILYYRLFDEDFNGKIQA